MFYPVHHIPGRLRIKSSLIKGNRNAAESMRAFIQSVNGINSVAVSPITGSAVITYARDVVTVQDILEELVRYEFPFGQGTRPEHPADMSPEIAERLVAKIVESFVQSLIERSALALVAALI